MPEYELKQFHREAITHFLTTYKEKLRPGTYTLISFRILTHPESKRTWAFLNCKEGRYWTASPLIVWELATDLGELIDKKLRKEPGSTMKFEVKKIMKASGRGRGLGFVL